MTLPPPDARNHAQRVDTEESLDPELNPSGAQSVEAAQSDASDSDAAINDDDVSRRVFVQHLTFMGGGVVLLGASCKKEEPKPAAPEAKQPVVETTKHRSLTNKEYAIMAAAVERLIPKDEDPGALEADVPEYIDRMLQSPQLKQMRDQLVPGFGALDRRAQRLFQTDFVSAKPEQRDQVLTAFKNSGEKTGEYKFYEFLMVLTLEGYLGDPSYGGNKGEAGWKLVGFKLVGRGPGDPKPGYDGQQSLDHLKCGSGKGC